MKRTRKPAADYSKAEVDEVRRQLDKYPVFLTRKQFAEVIGFDVKTTRRWQQHGRFPKPDRRMGNEDRWLKRRVLFYLLDKNSTEKPQPEQ